jgi:hypothetical protein
LGEKLIDINFINARIQKLQESYDATVERAFSIAGAIQEAVYFKSIIEGEEKKKVINEIKPVEAKNK